MKATPRTEADILEELVASGADGWTKASARSLLALRFSPRTMQRIRRLLRRNNEGTLATEERVTLDNYLRVGQFLDLVQAKARLLLRRATGGGR